MFTQKEIAHVLDRAAVRASAQNRRPATSKQCWFLAGLMLKASNLETDLHSFETDSLSMSDASGLIDMHLHSKS